MATNVGSSITTEYAELFGKPQYMSQREFRKKEKRWWMVGKRTSRIYCWRPVYLLSKNIHIPVSEIQRKYTYVYIFFIHLRVSNFSSTLNLLIWFGVEVWKNIKINIPRSICFNETLRKPIFGPQAAILNFIFSSLWLLGLWIADHWIAGWRENLGYHQVAGDDRLARWGENARFWFFSRIHRKWWFFVAHAIWRTDAPLSFFNVF